MSHYGERHNGEMISWHSLHTQCLCKVYIVHKNNNVTRVKELTHILWSHKINNLNVKIVYCVDMLMIKRGIPSEFSSAAIEVALIRLLTYIETRQILDTRILTV